MTKGASGGVEHRGFDVSKHGKVGVGPPFAVVPSNVGGVGPSPPGRSWTKSWQLEHNSTDAVHRQGSRSPYCYSRRRSTMAYRRKRRYAGGAGD